MSFQVMREQCDQCLFTPDRIVSSQRMASVLATCARNDPDFVCHKTPRRVARLATLFFRRVPPPTPESRAARTRAAIEEPGGRNKTFRNARDRWELHYTLQHYRDRVTSIIARAATSASKPATSSTG